VNRNFRLTRTTDFQRVRRHGKSYAHPLFVLVKLPNERESSRFGVAAGRSIGSAVQRNRAKRQLRESLRTCLPTIRSGWDILVIARRPMREATYQQILDALITLLRRANLLQEPHDI
jgi:ribonuclease P protein component